MSEETNPARNDNAQAPEDMERDAEQMAALPDEAVSKPQDQWICKNCGSINKPDAKHCERCGFDRGYDPDKTPEIDFSAVQAGLDQKSKEQHRRITLFIELAKVAMLFVIMVVALSISIRLFNSWPFMGAFERDAEAMANVVLSVHSHIEMGVSKGEYDELIVPLSVEKTRFKIKYGESAERQRDAFQKLVQAAEYYEMARDSWENELRSEDSQGRIRLSAMSTDVSEAVSKYWTTASSNGLRALEDLR